MNAMIRKALLVTIILVAIACLTIVAIGRYPRMVQPPAPTVHSNTNGVVNLAEVKPDMLLAAERAPQAPALAEGNWINSEPLTIANLRGRVVLVEFWTFGCYNCRNTLPSVKDWDARYRDRGLATVGVHTPETDSEYKIENVRKEVPSLGIRYPVVTDNDYKTWNSYGVEAWPAIFVLDKQGRVRWLHVGEGSYDETEGVIKKLLAE